ncbi:MAG: ribonuclease HI [Anaerolineae bacterium]
MSQKNSYYAVLKGHVPGIYSQWSGPGGAEAQVKGYPGAKFHGFPTRVEAEAWLKAQQDGDARIPATLPVSVGEQQTESPDHSTALAAGKVVIYTDGACIGNPGPGGYGVVLLFVEHRKELAAGFRRTTNNRMELMACIAGLQALKRKSRVVLYCDSKYVVDAINQGWARTWRQNGWTRNNTDRAENSDLWQILLDLCDEHSIEFVWVRGHVGTMENERCDMLSTLAAKSKDLPPDAVFEELRLRS